MNIKPTVLLCLLKLASINAMEDKNKIETLNQKLHLTMSDETIEQEERNKSILDLIQQGANVNYAIKIVNMAEDGKTPLFCVLNNPECVEILIKAGANVNADEGLGFTPIFKVIDEYLPPKSLELLLENGADVDHSNYYFGGILETALVRSIKFYIDNIVMLEQFITSKGDSFIIYKIKINLQDLSEYITLLIKYGANPNIKDYDSKSAFDYAKDYPEILEKLKQRKVAIKNALDQYLISPLVDIVAEY